MGITNALNNRPVRVLGFITAVHSLIYGLGYMFAFGGFTGTVLYVDLGNPITRYVFGTCLLITGLLLCFAFSRNNPKTIRYVTVVQSTVWIFAAVAYFSSGAFMLAIGIALPWVLISSYISYAFSKRLSILAYDLSPTAIKETKEEDKLYG